jgi:Tfp pilus assembly major pilin PilA
MIVVAIIGILAAIAIPLYANVQTRARVAKAQADARTLGSAVSIFTAHMGALPTALTDLTQQTANGLGQLAGPFVANVPTPPPGGSPAWSATYTYTSSSTGTFSITANGDGTTVTVP